jgi:hypothetical protein
MSDLHEQYIIDESGTRTGVILDLRTFTELLKAASTTDDRLKGVLEELEDSQAFIEALRATGEDAKVIPFDQATHAIENGRG